MLKFLQLFTIQFQVKYFPNPIAVDDAWYAKIYVGYPVIIVKQGGDVQYRPLVL
ncbi:hypothetical protein D3C77_439830 [compost metagenome]